MLNRKRLSTLLLSAIFSLTFINISTFSISAADKYAAAVTPSVAAAGTTQPGANATKKVTTKLVLNRSEVTLVAGQSLQLAAALQANGKILADKTKFTWKTDKTSNVKVDKQGKITAVKAGTKAVITAVSTDKKYTAACKVTVLTEKEAANCVALIGKLAVTKQEYTLFTRANMNSMLQNSPGVSPDKVDWSAQYNGVSLRESIKQQTFDILQELKIHAAKAKEAGLSLDANTLKEIESMDQAWISTYGDRKEAEKQIMSIYGITLAEYKEISKTIALARKYVESEHSKIKVSDAEIEKYYNTNKNSYDTVTVTHILISTIDSNGSALSEDKKLEARKQAEELLARVNSGEDIKELAKKYSQDPGVVENSGQYTFGKGEMVPSFEEWAFSHKAGETGLVESPYGYHVMKMDKHDSKTFKDLKEEIKQSLTDSKFIDSFTVKMEDLKSNPGFDIIVNKSVLDKLDKTLFAGALK